MEKRRLAEVRRRAEEKRRLEEERLFYGLHKARAARSRSVEDCSRRERQEQFYNYLASLAVISLTR